MGVAFIWHTRNQVRTAAAADAPAEATTTDENGETTDSTV
jgi:hypothetical protein